MPALQVVVPLMAAPLIVLRAAHACRPCVIATAASWCALAIAVALLLLVDASGTLSYAIGSWPPPWGIEYRVDAA